MSDADIIPISATVRHQQALDRFVQLLSEHVPDAAIRKMIGDAGVELASAAMAVLSEHTIAAMGAGR